MARGGLLRWHISGADTGLVTQAAPRVGVFIAHGCSLAPLQHSSHPRSGLSSLGERVLRAAWAARTASATWAAAPLSPLQAILFSSYFRRDQSGSCQPPRKAYHLGPRLPRALPAQPPHGDIRAKRPGWNPHVSMHPCRVPREGSVWRRATSHPGKPGRHFARTPKTHRPGRPGRHVARRPEKHRPRKPGRHFARRPETLRPGKPGRHFPETLRPGKPGSPLRPPAPPARGRPVVEVHRGASR